jgi:hypothetical protein
MRRLLWLGFAFTLVLLGIALAWAVELTRPIERGTARGFWASVHGVPLASGEEPNRPYLPMDDLYVYDPCGRGHRIEAMPYAVVSENEVMSLFPDVLARLIADPSGLTPKQVEVLSGKDDVSKEDGMRIVALERDAIGRSSERMRSFVYESFAAHLSEFDPGSEVSHIWRAEWLAMRLDRFQRYWATVAFEAVFFAALACLVWLPLLLSRARRWLPFLWGVLPLVFLSPYYLGYCHLAVFWPDLIYWGGCLYALLLSMIHGLTNVTLGWERDIVHAIPQILEPLNQTPCALLEHSVASPTGTHNVPTIGFMAPAAVGLAIALATYGVQRLIVRWRCARGTF